MRQLFERLSNRCLHAPAEPAVMQGLGAGSVVSISISDLVRQALSVHATLRRENWPAPVVPIFALRSGQCLGMMLGAALAGRAFACLNLRLKPPQIESILRNCGNPRLVCDSHGERLLRRNAASTLASRALVVPDSSGPPESDASRDAQELTTLAADHDGRAPACCLFTSGSTGESKGVLISGDDLHQRAETEVACYQITSADRLLNVLPFAFDVGLNQALTSLLAGAPLVISESWLPKDVLGAIEKFGVTGISGVPAVWRDLCQSGLRMDLSDAHSTLRYLTVSGGSLAPAELTALRALADGVDIFKTYGQTETFRSTILLPRDLARKTGSVGRAFPGAHVRTVNDDGQECLPNQVGEVVHSGLGVMLGYLGETRGDDKRRPNPFLRDEHDSAFAVWTGDLGYLDDEGFLYLEGRRDSMLKVAGNRFYPDEVAAALRTLAGVRDAEVVGVQTDAAETAVAAFVVTDAEAWTPDALRRVLRERVASYMVPSSIVIMPAIPRLPNGKPDRVRLLEMATPQQAQ